MADQSQIQIKPSPLRKFVWTLAMMGLLIGTGVALWQAYRIKQAAVLAEGEKTLQPVQETASAPAESSAGAPESPIATTPSEEFVHRVNTSVDFPPPPVSLSESDGWLRQELPVIDKNPQWIQWVNETPELLRKFVVLVNETAQGRMPRKLFGFWAPKESVRVEEIGNGEYLLDPASYHRYDQLALVVEALDPELAWRLYQRLRPWIDQVYGEFGQPGTNFDQVLLQAIEHLLQTPQPQGDIRLIKQAVTYQYVDPKLESLSAAQKQLLRMGPVNAAIIKHKLGLFRGFLLSQG